MWLLTSLWKEFGFGDAFRRVLRRERGFDADRLLRIMVFNRLCDPESKLGVLRWLESVTSPTSMQGRRRTSTCCGRWTPFRTAVTRSQRCALASRLRTLIDEELSIVFYDLTTIRTEGSSTVEGDVRQ